jgi:hypothetical protein
MTTYWSDESVMVKQANTSLPESHIPVHNGCGGLKILM